MCAGTILELWLTEHMESPIQFTPFILCGIGLIAVTLALLLPQRLTLIALRFVMSLLLAGGFFGVFQHIQHNVAFELEIRPNATIDAVWFDALRGANPLLAPGVLALAAVIALAATYYHPLLTPDS
jgi:hypothetical protein